MCSTFCLFENWLFKTNATNTATSSFVCHFLFPDCPQSLYKGSNAREGYIVCHMTTSCTINAWRASCMSFSCKTCFRVKSKQSHDTESRPPLPLFYYLQIHCYNLIELIGLWEFQTHYKHALSNFLPQSPRIWLTHFWPFIPYFYPLVVSILMLLKVKWLLNVLQYYFSQLKWNYWWSSSGSRSNSSVSYSCNRNAFYQASCPWRGRRFCTWTATATTELRVPPSRLLKM